jgi:hypothetical protein
VMEHRHDGVNLCTDTDPEVLGSFPGATRFSEK